MMNSLVLIGSFDPLPKSFFLGMWEESSPPFYYAALKIWSEFFGRSEAALRALSWLAMSLAVAATALLGARLGGQTLGVISGIVIALLPIINLYAQDARPVAFLPLLQGLVIFACIAEVQAMSRSPSPQGETSHAPRTSAVGLAVSCLLAIHTNPLSGFFVAATFVMLGLLALTCPDLGKRAILRWGVIGLFIFTASIPAVIALAMNATAGAHGWMNPWTFREAARVVMNLFLGEAAHGWPIPVRLAIISSLLALAVYGAFTFSWRNSAILAGIPILFIALIFFLSLIERVAQTRYFLGVMMPFAVLVSAGACKLFTSRSRQAALCALLVAGLAALSTRQALREGRGEWHQSTDWRSLTAVLKSEASCRGPVHARTPVGLTAWPYYGDSVGPRFRTWIPSEGGQSEPEILPFEQYLERATGYRTLAADEFAARLRAGGPLAIVFVTRHPDSSPLMRFVRQHADPAAIVRYHFPPELHLLCVGARGSTDAVGSS